MLLVDLLGIFMLAMCFPLYDLLRTEEVLASANARLAHFAERDPLTGVYNRRVFLDRLEQELERHRQSVVPMSLILFDMDHFKNVNDTYGHAVGDEVLKNAVATAQPTLRDGDVLARYGGEEFTILLPGTPLAAAARIAERVREALEYTQTRFDSALHPRVTASFGVTAAAGRTVNSEDLLYAVDDAVYTAKHEGRNRVCVRATRPGESQSHILAEFPTAKAS
jgi:diguanylate cyclase (GGDEF)-like protein